ncbi:hypothetical protein ACFV3G_04015, partial [Streptomyces sp. NPDC059712]
MTVDVLRRPALVDRRARLAVAVLFFTNGALFANLLPRYPQIKADLGVGVAAPPVGGWGGTRGGRGGGGGGGGGGWGVGVA